MKKLLLLIVLLASEKVFSQEIVSAKKIVDTLASSTFWGRGYTKNGVQKAAIYIENEFKKYGLLPLDNKSYLQKLSYSVNTFPSKVALYINDKKLIAGEDYIITPNSKGLCSKGLLQPTDSIRFSNPENSLHIQLEKKLTWSVSQKTDSLCTIKILKSKMPDNPVSYRVCVKNKFIKNFKTANICGFVRGTVFPDSFIFITAHYDHLGGMGSDTYFPGANDNASGTALLLNLAQYYAKNPAPYSIGFICFTGEEAGLMGSKHFVNNPIIPLKNIKLLLNTDLAGTGEDGITIVNATAYKKEFDLMNAVNDSLHLLKKIVARGKAANSDHYYFSEHGVPALFFYTMGGISAYHDVYDRAATLPLTKHEALYQLIIAFNKRWMIQY